MSHAIHITTLKRILQSPEPVDLKNYGRALMKSNAGTTAFLFAMTSTKAREE
uniref:hypothetical protein n=1 Tax=Alloprevotella sp. TaxID=1872471 RepID=UPI0040295AE7